ncbi:MAG: ribonuclease J [Alphaproteobacteria bacterium]|nr:MAG: ribonuclease J [Alphaproteobacteria bacterium]
MTKSSTDPHRPPDNAFWFLPLGGSGEIGANMNLYGTQGKWLMVDCGITFGEERSLGADVLVADADFITQRRDDLVGLVLTHGHEDHLGAIEYLWPHLQCPVYATPFSAGLLRAKLSWRRHGAPQVRIIETPIEHQWNLGPFQLETIAVTHSIPEARMVAITTKHGTILHTGDWKIDPHPQKGPLINQAALRALGDRGLMSVVGDSTCANATSAGHSNSEEDVKNELISLFGNHKQLIGVTCFSTNAVRVGSIVEAAQAHGRHVVVAGRSLWRMIDIAQETGYLSKDATFLSVQDAESLPRDKIALICTGSQGEARAALARMSVDSFPDFELEAEDAIIFSSRDIPGNERPIARIRNNLLQRGISVITWRDRPFVHASGHPYPDELTELYQWTRPRMVVPVHGEYEHQTAHADIAKKTGVERSLISTNGVIIDLNPDGPGEVGRIETGKLVVDGRHLRPVRTGAMGHRRRMAEHGGIMVTLVMDQAGRLLQDPRASLLGLGDNEGTADPQTQNQVAQAARRAVNEMAKSLRIEDAAVEQEVTHALRRMIDRGHGKKPLIQIHIVRV